MRSSKVGLLTLAVCLVVHERADAHWFRFLNVHRAFSVNSSNTRNLESTPRKPENLESPETPAPFTIESSGLEEDIKQRIAYWQPKKDAVVESDGTTTTITVQAGGQTIEIKIRVIGSGGTVEPGVVVPPSGDLTKTLQAAFTSDPAPKGATKEAARLALIPIFEKLAKEIGGPAPTLPNKNAITTKGEARRFWKATLLTNFNPNSLKNTQVAIERYLDKFMPESSAAALNAGERTKLATEFDNVAKALKSIK